MNLLEGGKGGWGREGGGEGGEGTWGREWGWGERGRGGWGGEGMGEEKWREGGREGGGGEGWMTVVHILIGMFNSNPMIPQYLSNNRTWYYVTRRSITIWRYYVTRRSTWRGHPDTHILPPSQTRALLRLERTMNLLEGGKGEGGWGREGGEGTEGGDVGGWGREGGEGRGGNGREGWRLYKIIVIGMFTSNPMIPQYLNNNLT